MDELLYLHLILLVKLLEAFKAIRAAPDGVGLDVLVSIALQRVVCAWLPRCWSSCGLLQLLRLLFAYVPINCGVHSHHLLADHALTDGEVFDTVDLILR